jgi:DNA-directed RNA polymerase specialized sigma24 family protein
LHYGSHVADDPLHLQKVLGKLSKRERLVCIWKIAGLPSEQIAGHEGCSATEIDAIFLRAKRKLRRALRQQSDGVKRK